MDGLRVEPFFFVDFLAVAFAVFFVPFAADFWTLPFFFADFFALFFLAVFFLEVFLVCFSEKTASQLLEYFAVVPL